MSNAPLRATSAVDDPSIQTYRYVRASIVGSVLLLFAAVGLQIVADGGAVESSISAYYYGPARSVFVGILVAMGLALVAIKGRSGLEEIALNLAGMLAPVVAFVPTTVLASKGTCPEDVKRCIDAQFLPGVENNMGALILVGPPVLVFAWWTSRKHGTTDRSGRLSLWGATAVWAVFAAWFWWGPRQPFLDLAHYVSAVLMFGLVIVVVAYNALRTDHAFSVAGGVVSYRRLYSVIAALMAITLVTAVVYFFVTGADTRLSFPWIFLLETILLTLFMAFWVVQTKEFWNEGLPVEAQCPVS